MSLLLIQLSSEQPASLLTLAAGQSLVFGRGAGGADVRLLLDHPGISRLAGEIHTVQNYWHLSNWSSKSTYVVENVEAIGEHLAVHPGRSEVPIPFEIASVLLPAARDLVRFTVYSPAQPVAGPIEPVAIDGTRTEEAFPLDRKAKYFLVLVALCEPRLRGRAGASFPTAVQVARRLRPLPGCDKLNARAVDFHIDYLARDKLRLRPSRIQDGFAARRSALIDFALRFGLVDDSHLALLPPLTSRPAAQPC